MIQKKLKNIFRQLINGGGDAVGIRKAFPDGHFYSPLVNIGEIKTDEGLIWPLVPSVAGIDFNEIEQKRWLTEILPRHLQDYDYPDDLPEGAAEGAFYTRNSQFSWLDSRVLFAVLREMNPRRIIEIGSSFSSLLAADVNHRFLGGRLDMTCIEPYPRSFLRGSIPGLTRLVEARVQDVPFETFASLDSGDILFIDSSHVAKTGSDVNFIYFEVLPRLRPGVLIHVHDIFLPNDYPKDWVVNLGFHWNEQYLLRALLIDSHGFEVLFGCAYVLDRFPDLLRKTLGGSLFGGGSFWLRRTGLLR